jgi:hypothetical protein
MNRLPRGCGERRLAGLLKTGARHPSYKVSLKLVAVLALAPRELFFLADLGTKAPVSQGQRTREASAWDAFTKDETLRNLNIVG